MRRQVLATQFTPLNFHAENLAKSVRVQKELSTDSSANLSDQVADPRKLRGKIRGKFPPISFTSRRAGGI
jgi:hypothetical protein